MSHTELQSLHDQQVLVVGLAQTGVAVAHFCAARGARVTVTDSRSADAIPDRIQALGGVARLELGGHDQASFTGADLIVMSPGVPELSQTRAARAAGVEVIAEIELAYRYLTPSAQLVAITGTNGKSTTTALIGSLCQAASDHGAAPTFCGGNLGNQLLIEAVEHPANRAGGFVVAEVAGFMLETCVSFRPKVAICLNITEDHLDRFGTMDVYAAMKMRIYEWQTAHDFAIANANCERTVAGARASAAELYLFDSMRPLPPGVPGAYLAPGPDRAGARRPGRSNLGEIVLRTDRERRFPISDLPLVGVHNLENAMAAYLAAHLVGVSDDDIRTGARQFQPQKHRMELIGERADVHYYDDSKGTNVAAVAAAMRGFPRPVVLIAGGVDKGGSYAPMFEALQGTARGMVLIGEARPIIRQAASEANVDYPILDASTMLEAVQKATGLAHEGDAVVLSPACASYDMFKNFGQRGMAFRAAVSAVGARRFDIDEDTSAEGSQGPARPDAR